MNQRSISIAQHSSCENLSGLMKSREDCLTAGSKPVLHFFVSFLLALQSVESKNAGIGL